MPDKAEMLIPRRSSVKLSTTSTEEEEVFLKEEPREVEGHLLATLEQGKFGPLLNNRLDNKDSNKGKCLDLLTG